MFLLVVLLFSKLTFASFEEQIKLKLENEVLTKYIPQIQRSLGICSSGNCLSDYDFLTLEVSDGKEICLPFTKCGFYECMEDKFRCSDVGVNYFTKLAAPTCGKYVENISEDKFSQKGIEWIYSVMVCLQKGLIDECEVRGNCDKANQKKTCDYITKFTLDFHPSCYINSGVGVCKLPLKDKISIWSTVSEFLTAQERIQAYKVVFSCIIPG